MPRYLSDSEQAALCRCRLASRTALAAAAKAASAAQATPLRSARPKISYTPDLSRVPEKILASMLRAFRSIEKHDALCSSKALRDPAGSRKTPRACPML
jgi:hypothetical protein